MSIGPPFAVLAAQLVDTDREIDAALAILGLVRMPGFDLAEIEAALLSQCAIFRCSQCRQWLSTVRIDPDKEEWCYACALAWKEKQAAQDVLDEENNKRYGADGKELEED
jgi:hypothetical protein